MLPRNLRLNKESAFKATYRVKNSCSDEFLILFAGRPKKDKEAATRAGFVVSKKNHKRAVKRNRLKRLMREAYRTALKENKIDNAQNFMSLIFTARNPAIGMDYKTIQASVLKLTQKIKIK